MSDEEREAFEQIPYFEDGLTLRRWDDLAKVKGLEIVGLEPTETSCSNVWNYKNRLLCYW